MAMNGHQSYGRMRARIAFDRAVREGGGLGPGKESWSELFACRAQVFFARGSEAVDAGSLQSDISFKVRLRNREGAKRLFTRDRMRLLRGGALLEGVQGDPLPGQRLDIVSIDTVTSRKWAWLTVRVSEMNV